MISDNPSLLARHLIVHHNKYLPNLDVSYLIPNQNVNKNPAITRWLLDKQQKGFFFEKNILVTTYHKIKYEIQV